MDVRQSSIRLLCQARGIGPRQDVKILIALTHPARDANKKAVSLGYVNDMPIEDMGMYCAKHVLAHYIP